MAVVLSCLDSDTDDSLELEILLSSSHLPPTNAEQLKFIRWKAEERKSRHLERPSKLPASIGVRASPTTNLASRASTTNVLQPIENRSVISPDPGLKDPPSYPSHIQRKADDFVANEQRQMTSKNRSPSRQKEAKSKPSTAITNTKPKTTTKAGKSQYGNHNNGDEDQSRQGTKSPENTKGRTMAVITQRENESDSDATESMDEKFPVDESEKDDDPEDSDSSVAQAFVASITRNDRHAPSSVMKKEDQGEDGVSLNLDSTSRSLSQLGNGQDDAIILSSDSEAEDGEWKQRDDNSKVVVSEDVHSHDTTPVPCRFPRRCKVKTWTDAEKKEYMRAHPCIGRKGLPIKTAHKDRKCVSCGRCRTCTRPPFCSTIEKHEFEEDSAQNQASTTATKNDQSNPTTISRIRKPLPSKHEINSKIRRKPGSPKRKSSDGEKSSRKKAKICTETCEEDSLEPRMRAASFVSASAEDDISTPRHSSQKELDRVPSKAKKAKKKKRKKKRKSKGTLEQSGAGMENYQFLVDRMMKLEKELDEQKRLNAKLSPKSEQSEMQLPVSSNRSPAQPSVANFFAREDLQRAMEGAMHNISVAAHAPIALQGFPVASYHRLGHGLQFMQTSQAKPELNQSAQFVVSLSELKKISHNSQRPQSIIATFGNQDGKDVNATGGMGGCRQTPQTDEQEKQHALCSVASADTARAQTADSTVSEDKSAENDINAVVESNRVQRLKQQRNERKEALNEGIQRLRQQSNTSTETVPKQNTTSLEGTAPHQLFPDRERTQILLLLLIILATATTEPPVLNGIVFVLVAFGIIMAESGIWRTS